MPQAVFVQDGAAVDYVSSGTLAAGDVVVQGDLVGVIKRPLTTGELGALSVEGVFDFAKSTGVAYTVGQILYWDDAANVVTLTATGNKLIGKVVRAAATTDTSVRVRMSQ